MGRLSELESRVCKMDGLMEWVNALSQINADLLTY